MAVVTGALAAGLLAVSSAESVVQHLTLIGNFMAALAVGLGILVMAASHTDHPSAAGTALGLVIDGWSW